MQNLNHLVSLLQEGYVTIGVVFAATAPSDFDDQEPPMAPWNGGRQQPQPPRQQVYTYKCHFECISGDLVILPPSGTGKLPSIGTVVRVDDEPELNFESGIEYKWAIARLDTAAYDEVMKRERDLVKMLREQEKKQQRAKLLESYQLSLPDDAESRKIFDQARQIGIHPKDI